MHILDNESSRKIAYYFYSYGQYMSLMTQFVRLEITSGLSFNAKLVELTKLNFSRMKRLNKTIIIPEQYYTLLNNLEEKQEWIVISEAWCGDSAQILPGIAKMAESSNGKINLKIAFRDNNPKLMDAYLTNGGRAIPKLIVRDSFGNDLFTWGPRPQAASEIVKNWKLNQTTIPKEEMEKTLHEWYGKNKCNDVMTEIINLIKPD